MSVLLVSRFERLGRADNGVAGASGQPGGGAFPKAFAGVAQWNESRLQAAKIHCPAIGPIYR
jgi:hypothetical protein